MPTSSRQKLVAFPVVLVVAPLARRGVAALVDGGQ
jgi:hypothetical protein